jgi:exopolysaccharide biosynthesis polyprenyl glycosylphosphotransferase
MSKSFDRILLFVTDFLTIHAAFLVWCRLRQNAGFISQYRFENIAEVSIFVYLFWLTLFVFFGLYRFIHAQSRTDEFIAVVKTVSIGILIIFMITVDMESDLQHPISASRIMILLYWIVMVLMVGSGRVMLRSIHRRLLQAGIGRRRALIIGCGNKAKELYERVLLAPALGYDVIGFVRDGDASCVDKLGPPVLGAMGRLNRLIVRRSIQEVLIAMPRRSEKELAAVISQCDGTSAGIKIVPDLYDVLIGQVRTNQIYGFPLIDVLPDLMPAWERIVKRMIDMVFSSMVLIGFLPVWLLTALAIRIDSSGPIFYRQERVGRDGKIFKIIKFRSMIQNAENKTGPVWASDNDPRITKLGRILRKTRIDEIPQFINVLDGAMSLVGPRPERPFFVEKLKAVYPLYTRRLRVRPGITGWAQVKGEYDQTIEDVKKKIEFDLFYLENMSLRMDLKIILNTVYVVLLGKGK